MPNFTVKRATSDWAAVIALAKEDSNKSIRFESGMTRRAAAFHIHGRFAGSGKDLKSFFGSEAAGTRLRNDRLKAVDEIKKSFADEFGGTSDEIDKIFSDAGVENGVITRAQLFKIIQNRKDAAPKKVSWKETIASQRFLTDVEDNKCSIAVSDAASSEEDSSEEIVRADDVPEGEVCDDEFSESDASEVGCSADVVPECDGQEEPIPKGRIKLVEQMDQHGRVRKLAMFQSEEERQPLLLNARRLHSRGGEGQRQQDRVDNLRGKLALEPDESRSAELRDGLRLLKKMKTPTQAEIDDFRRDLREETNQIKSLSGELQDVADSKSPKRAKPRSFRWAEDADLHMPGIKELPGIRIKGFDFKHPESKVFEAPSQRFEWYKSTKPADNSSLSKRDRDILSLIQKYCESDEEAIEQFCRFLDNHLSPTGSVGACAALYADVDDLREFTEEEIVGAYRVSQRRLEAVIADTITSAKDQTQIPLLEVFRDVLEEIYWTVAKPNESLPEAGLISEQAKALAYQYSEQLQASSKTSSAEAES